MPTSDRDTSTRGRRRSPSQSSRRSRTRSRDRSPYYSDDDYTYSDDSFYSFTSLFIFINRGRDRMKMLHFASGGFWLYYRVLEAGTFEKLSVSEDCRHLQLDATELSMLLSGVSLTQSQKRRKRFSITGCSSRKVS